MSLIKNFSVGVIFTGVSFMSASAIEIPAPVLAKPLGADAAVDSLKDNSGEFVEKTAWLGVKGDAIPELLGRHLGIKKGVALSFVLPESPASKAGLKNQDVIVQIGQNEIGSQQDLRAALFDRSPGDVVDTVIIREGKRLEQKVVLGTRPSHHQGRQNIPNARPQPRMNDIRQQFGRGLGLPDDEMRQLFEMLNKEMPGFEGFGDFRGGQFQQQMQLDGNGQGSKSMKMTDNDGSITLNIQGEKKHLLAKDKAGNVLFDGPTNTEKERALVPKDILKRADALEKGGGLGGFKFHIK